MVRAPYDVFCKRDTTNYSGRTPRPPKGDLDLKVGILTVSDRAYANAYETGDLSGPAVEGTVIALVERMNSSFQDKRVSIGHVEKTIVPDKIPPSITNPPLSPPSTS